MSKANGCDEIKGFVQPLSVYVCGEKENGRGAGCELIQNLFCHRQMRTTTGQNHWFFLKQYEFLVDG